MDWRLVKLGKETLIQKLKEEVLKGDPREKIRLVDINWNKPEQAECIKQLIEEGYIEPTKDKTICLISQSFFQQIKKENNDSSQN